MCLRAKRPKSTKLLVDRLYEPLVHVVRNSADHGLEIARGSQVAAGKARKGPHHPFRRAGWRRHPNHHRRRRTRPQPRTHPGPCPRARSVRHQTKNPTTHALWRVIFQPGFSTAETVTNLSGRGVGHGRAQFDNQGLARPHRHRQPVGDRAPRSCLSIPADAGLSRQSGHARRRAPLRHADRRGRRNLPARKRADHHHFGGGGAEMVQRSQPVHPRLPLAALLRRDCR